MKRVAIAGAVVALLSSTLSGAPKVTEDISVCETIRTQTRTAICLNGYWYSQYGPADAKAAAPPAAVEGGIVRVPGSASSGSFAFWTPEGKRLWNDQEYKGQSRKKCLSVWYIRPFVIPRELEGKRLLIRFGNISKNNRVFLNGKPVGRAGVLEPEVDITDVARVGESNRLSVLLTTKNYKEGKAIFGSVWLAARGKGATVAGALAIPHLSPKRLDVRVRVANPAAAASNVTLRVHVAEQDGRTRALDIPETTVEVPANGTVETTVGKAFPKAHIWDIDDPYLYRLRVDVVKGSTLVDQWETRFGFRAVSLKGHEMFLNGKKFHGRFAIKPGLPNCIYSRNRKALRAVIADQRQKGYNGTQAWEPIPGRVLDVCDEEGWVISNAAVERERNEKDEDYAERVSRYVYRFGNHPSILIWWSEEWAALYFNNVWPAILDELYHRTHAQESLEKIDAIYREIDPTRIIKHYGSGVAGTTFLSVLPYLPPGLPLQEHRDWPRQWYVNGRKKPLYLCEFDIVSKWAYRNYDFQNIWQESTTDYVEHSARWLGEAAYAQIRKALCDYRGADGRIDGGDLWAAHYADCWMNATCAVGKATFRAWRTYDVAVMSAWVATGGWPECSVHPYENLTGSGVKKIGENNYLTKFPDDPASLGVDDMFPDRVELFVNPVWEPWALDAQEKRPTAVFGMMQREHGPILIYIGGHPEFTAQDHTYFAGEKITKQIVAINDTRHDLPLEITVALAARTIATETRTLKPGEVHIKPFSFAAPATRQRRDAELTLRATTKGKVVYEDTFTLTFFPKQTAPAMSVKTVLYDTKGLTAAVLDAAGVTYTKVSSPAELAGCDCLVIGRESWDEAMAGRVLAEALRGGLTILSFEQTPESVIGAHLKERSERLCFVQGEGHPILSGLADSDFKNWRGSSDIIEAYPRITEFPRLYFPHWGNKGVVSTYPLMKGHFGNFRYLVAAGYDLREAIVAEMLDGKGRLLLCQADVTSRYGTDPVATVLVNNLLAYAARKTRELAPAVYVGGADGAELLKDLKIAFKEADSVPASPGSVVIVDGATLAARGSALARFADAGGTVVTLPIQEEGDIAGLPFTLSLSRQGVFRTLFTARPKWLQGLGQSDFYLRNQTVGDGWKPGKLFEFQTLTLGGGTVYGDSKLLAEVPQGKGRFVFCQLDPRPLAGWQAHPKGLRVWSTLLTNLGVASSASLSFQKTHTLDLAGSWHLRLDKETKGIEKGWPKRDFCPKVTASTSEIPALKAFDGDLETYWKSSFKDRQDVGKDGVPAPEWHDGKGQWLMVDFSKPVTFDRVKLYLTTKHYVKHFAVQYAKGDKPEKWVNIGTGVDNEKFEFDYKFTPVTARYVRVAGTTSYTLEGKAINCRPVVRELEIYDGDTSLTEYFHEPWPLIPAPYDDGTKSFPNRAWLRSVFSYHQGYKGYAGDAWWGRAVLVPETLRGRDVHLIVGSVNDDDWVYVNGKLVASTVGAPAPKQLWLYRPRDYAIPAEAFHIGAFNNIVIRTRHKKIEGIPCFGGLLCCPMRLESRPRPLFPQIEPITHYDPDKYYQW